MQLRGTYTAIVTPFRGDGSIDEEALASLVEHQVASGVEGVVPCGTTGEGSTMTPAEQRRVVETVVRAARRRVTVIAGAGGSDTRGACALAAQAAEAGADAVLTVTPPYNKPPREGLVAHYREVARAAGLPVVLYNVPGRTGLNMGADTILRLAQVPGVVAVKEASGSVAQVEDVLRRRPEGFAVLSGDDSLTLPLLALGVEGVVSVVSNEVPRAFSDLVRAALAGDFATARRLHFALAELMVLNFVESNPIPVKTALEHLGLVPEAHFRLPLVPMSADARAKLVACLDALDLPKARPAP